MISQRLDPNNEPTGDVRRVTRNGRETDAIRSTKTPLTNTRDFDPTTLGNRRTLSPPVLHKPRTSAIATPRVEPPIHLRRISEPQPAQRSTRHRMTCGHFIEPHRACPAGEMTGQLPIAQQAAWQEDRPANDANKTQIRIASHVPLTSSMSQIVDAAHSRFCFCLYSRASFPWFECSHTEATTVTILQEERLSADFTTETRSHGEIQDRTARTGWRSLPSSEGGSDAGSNRPRIVLPAFLRDSVSPW
jgi:hypothetical protein